MALTRARDLVSHAPQLVPLYAHRYLPAGRGSAGQPVLSLYNADIIWYGMDLVDYLYQEFGAGQGIERTDPR